MGELRLVGVQGLTQQQPLALLCYLALTGPRTRRHLAAVFWPEARQPLNNLSSALTRIRRCAPDLITVQGNTIATPLQVDAAELEAAIASSDSDRVLELYEGHFLHSTDLRDVGLELEEWIFGTREALARGSAETLLAAAEAAESDKDAADLAGHAYRIVQSFWIDSTVWPRCHALVVGVDPGLAEKIRISASQQGIEIAQPDLGSAKRVRRDEPQAPASDLLGRDEELETLDDFVDELPAEWLTISGMGGVGKTALAREFRTRTILRRPNVAATWVSLADIDSPERAATAIAGTLGVTRSGDEDLVTELRSRCSAETPMVLILDNLEQVANPTSIIEPLADIDHLAVIVTSRIATEHPRERPLLLTGLTSIQAGAGHAMFCERARPHLPDIDRHPELVARLCELVDGLPLAIELCAAWLRVIPLRVIVDSLDTSGELVAASPDTALESMHSILERSWNLLDALRARVLGRLALFEAPFDHLAATQVGDSDLRVIGDLISSSLIERRDDDLVLHPLTREFALARLRAGDPLTADAAEVGFVEYVHALMLDASSQLRGPEAGKVSPALAAGFTNVQAGWRLALQRQTWRIVADMADGIDQHLRSASQQWLTARLFDEALGAMAEHVERGDAAASAAFVAVGWRRAMVGVVQGQREHAAALLERCLGVCGRDDHAGWVGLRYVQGHLALFEGHYQTAASHFEAARSRADGPVDEWFVAQIDAASALAALSVDDNDRARRLLRSVLDTGRRLSNPVNITSAYYFLGSLEMVDNPRQALLFLDEGRLVAEKSSLTHISRKYATLIGRCHITLGDAPAAIAVFEEALVDTADTPAVNEPWVRVANRAGLAMALALDGDSAAAADGFTEALRSQVELVDWPLLIETTLEVCRLRSDCAQDPEWATEWTALLQLVANHPACLREWTRDVKLLLAAAHEHTVIDLRTTTTVAAGGSGVTISSAPPEPDAPSEELRIDIVAERTLALLRC